ncbi:hypothetical protein ACFY1L_03990 [Streptomyces sp. NPDC001663]|uniref:hypothetical protein n=1 Tax=Streptomyces sp. NPDC001663 TaxID=3364597 RepID=UPI0036B75548
MSQRTRKTTRARMAAVLAAPVLTVTLLAPCASAADTPAKCEGTTHVSLLGHEACLTPSDDETSSKGDKGDKGDDDPLGSLLGLVTGLLGGLLGGLGGG